jgi:hypothetical protein
MRGSRALTASPGVSGILSALGESLQKLPRLVQTDKRNP